MNLWNWFKKFWATKQVIPATPSNNIVNASGDVVEKAIETEFPFIFVKYDYKQGIIFVQVGWPEKIDSKVITEGFAETLLTLESGNLHETIKGTIISLCQMRKDEQLCRHLIRNIDMGISNMREHNPVPNDLSMYPNEVFGQKYTGQNQ